MKESRPLDWCSSVHCHCNQILKNYGGVCGTKAQQPQITQDNSFQTPCHLLVARSAML